MHNRMTETLSCEKCNHIFHSIEEVKAHVELSNHHTFRLLGTKFTLSLG